MRIDYGARWYDPYLNRWTSPDSIIPDPYDPLSWDRYSYVRNNPVRYIDPYGHRPTCSSSEECKTVLGDYVFDGWSYDRQAAKYGLKFTGDWSKSDKRSVLSAAFHIGSSMKSGAITDITNVFKRIFGGTEIEHANYSCDEGCWGRAVSSTHVRFYTESTGKLDPRLVVHEFGHVFNARVANINLDGDTPYTALDATFASNSSFPRRGDPGNAGFAGPQWGWQQSGEDSSNEEFADMFVGWVFNRFASNPGGSARSAWMNAPEHMQYWVYQLWISGVNQ